MKKITFLVALFLTFFNQANAQFNEGFEAGIPATWTVIDGGDAGNTWVQFLDPIFVISGTASAAITYGATAHDDYLITPAIAVTVGVNDRFSFKARSFDAAYPEQFDLKVSTTTPTAAAFTTTLATIAPNSALTVATDYSFDLSAYAGQVIYIGMHSTTTDMWRISVDDVVNDTPPACESPTALTSSAIATTTATIAWTASTSIPSGGYQYYYDTTNTAPTAATTPSGSVAAGVTTANLMTLLPSTQYYYWVRSDCGGVGTSAWSVSGTFTTACTVFIAPFTEAFSSTLPNCWTSTTTGTLTTLSDIWNFTDIGTGNHIGNNGVITGSTASGSFFAWVDDSGATANQATLTSPLIDVSSLTTPRLTFFELSNNEGQQNSILTVSAWDGAAWNTMQTYNSNTVGGWEKKIIDLSSLTITGPIQVRFVVTEDAVGFYDDIAIDDVTVEETPSCSEPTLLTSSAITTTTATISWTAPSVAPTGGYQYYYTTTNTAPTAATTPSGTVAAGITTANLTTLTSNTQYFFWVRSDCGGSGTSPWSISANFLTQCDSTVVPYIMNFETATVPALPNCTAQENVGSGNLWTVANNPGYGFTTNALRYIYNSANSANVWFYTQGVTLVGGTAYAISFDYGSTGTTFPEKLKVAYGTSASATSMTNSLVDLPNVVNATPLNNVVQFTPATSGVYYFGFNAYSDADQFYLFVDNINLDLFLSTNSFDSANFVAYPNPVKDVLNLSYITEISSVRVINLLGQEVISRKVNNTNSQIDMTSLTAGAYIVNVTIGDVVKTIKIIKQ